MAAFTAAAAAVSIPSFTGVKVECSKVALGRISAYTRPRASVRASMSENVGKMGAVLLAASASVLIANHAAEAKAVEVLMGGSGGELAFIPSEFQIASGETITFKNNAGFPHNVVFEEDEVPEGVDVSTISMPEEQLLNAPGQTYQVKLEKKGTYKFYCSPHQGTGMSGRVTVN